MLTDGENELLIWLKNYFTFDDYTPETNSEGTLTYKPSRLVSQITVTGFGANRYHLKSTTPILEVSNPDVQFLKWLSFDLSISQGCTIHLNQTKMRLEALVSASINLDDQNEDWVFQISKLHLFAIQTLKANAKLSQLLDPLAEVLETTHKSDINAAAPKVQSIIQAISRRPQSPSLPASIEDIRISLETEVTARTGRFNYANIPLEDHDTDLPEDYFSYSEFGENEGRSASVSFHASYKGRDLGDTWPLHAGLIVGNASKDAVEDLQTIILDHFNNPELSLFGYYYVTHSFGAGYVSRLTGFMFEILQNDIPGLSHQKEFARFLLEYCLETYKSYIDLETVSRSRKTPEPVDAQKRARNAANQVKNLSVSSVRSQPDYPIGINIPLHEQWVFDSPAGKLRLYDFYISRISHGAEVRGIARLSLEVQGELGSISISINFPDFETGYRSEIFELQESVFVSEFAKLVDCLSKYRHFAHGDRYDIWGSVQMEPWLIAAVDDALESWTGQYGPSTENEVTDSWKLTVAEWDSAETTSSVELPIRLRFDESGTGSGPRSFLFV